MVKTKHLQDSVKHESVEHEKISEKVVKTKKPSRTKTHTKSGNSLVVVNDGVPSVSNMPTSRFSRKILLHSDVSSDKEFVLCDGKRLKNVRELADALHLMNDDMFKYHVTDTKNDFANWINDVYLDIDFAKKLRNDRGRIEMCIEVYKELLEELKHK